MLTHSNQLASQKLLLASSSHISLPAALMGAPSPVSRRPSEHQYWIDPIICEESWVWLEHFHNLGWLSLNCKSKTLQGIAVVEWYWAKLNLTSLYSLLTISF